MVPSLCVSSRLLLTLFLDLRTCNELLYLFISLKTYCLIFLYILSYFSQARKNVFVTVNPLVNPAKGESTGFAWSEPQKIGIIGHEKTC